MKKAIFCLILLSSICRAKAENIAHKVDSMRSLLKASKNDTNKAKILADLSGHLILADKYDSALIVSGQALSLSESLEWKPGIAAAYRKMGVAYIQTGEFAKALDLLLKSLRINEELNNREEIFKLNNNIGNMYYGQGNYKSALSYFMKAYAYSKNDAFTNSNIGITYLAEEKYDTSLKFLEKALVLYEQDNDESGMGNTINYIGTVYEYQGSYGQAIEHYFQALKIKEEIGDIQGQADALGGIGDILIKQKKYDEAIVYQNKSIVLARQIGYLISVQETENRLYEIYDAMGQKDKAYDHYRKYISIRDSLYNEELIKKTVRSEMSFDFDKREAIKNAVHNEELKHQQTQRNAFIGGFILVLIFSIFIFRGYRRTHRQKIIIEAQKKLVDYKNKEITDSINYAQRIQRAILPSDEYMNRLFPENLICYRPRDIVSGDFYWSYTDGTSRYLATADCTGHSVPGAMMSMIGASLLNEIVIERKITSPEQILNMLREEIIRTINQEGADEERKDGMDISLIKLTDNKLECSAANNPVYIIKNGSLAEIKADRFPVGKYVTDLPFTLKTMELEKGDTIYMQSDGFCDQFGSLNGKKLMTKRFKEWIVELSILEMSEIKRELEIRFDNWKGSESQVDDVMVVAIRV